jgi:RNA polymerase-binding transcription factor DksA
MLEAPKGAVLALTAGSAPDRAEPAPPVNAQLSDAELLERMSGELDAVEAALARLDQGGFDACDTCGARIGADLLVADPLLTKCAAHR